MNNDLRDIDTIKYVRPRSWFRTTQDNYAYAFEATRTKAKFSHLFDKNDYRELIYNDGDELNWVSWWARLFNSAFYEVKDTVRETLELGYSDNDALLKDLCGKEKAHFAEILLLENDYHNAKVILKIFILALNNENVDTDKTGIEKALKNNKDLLHEEANFELVDLVDLIVSRLNGVKKSFAVSDLFEDYLDLVIAKISEFDNLNLKDLAVVDSYLDKAYYKHFLELLETEEYLAERELLTDYISIKADSSNLQSFYRAKKLNLDFETYVSEFVSGGYIDITRYEELFKLDIDVPGTVNLLDEEGSLISDLLQLAFENNINEFLTDFSLLRDNLLLSLSENARGMIAGPEIIFALWLSKRIEIINLRMVLAGHELAIDKAVVEKNLRKLYGEDFYVG